ncbi:hypothetical protein CASFOL_008751 [Castilleja foliolosa]|uniref:KIB1-4 beta-propeller domain-containing protein n=1 Tax=Castilleja foliolosa TaxID=1961234 RepID=A0ABD3DZW0_9LAMI
MYSSMAQSVFSSSPSFVRPSMAPTTFSSSPKLIRLVPTFKSPNFRRTMSITAAHINNPSPCLMLPPTFDDGSDEMVYNMYNLAQNKVLKFNNKKLIPEKDTRIVGSSHGWLALFDERNCDLILTNPVTRSHVKLPPSKSDISSGVKVILSCDAEQEDCQAMMIYDISRLAFCRPGRSPTEWTPLGVELTPNKNRRCYEDIVYSSRHNLFFCVTETGNGSDFEAWDVASASPRLRWENRDDLLTYHKYGKWLMRAEGLLRAETGWFTESFTYLVFVEQTDQLFFVTRHIVRQMAPDGSSVDDLDKDLDDDRYPYKTVSFDVLKVDWELDGEGGRLSYLDGGSLDGLAMFVGLNHSFAVMATEDNGLKPNSIYFTDDKELTPPIWDVVCEYGGHDIGIFDYENKTTSSCYYPCDIQSFKRIKPEPIWFTPSHN